MSKSCADGGIGWLDPGRAAAALLETWWRTAAAGLPGHPEQ
jgi:hypothetical protein